MKVFLARLSPALLALLLAACGGGGKGSDSPTTSRAGNDNVPTPTVYSIGGTVAGLPIGAQISVLDNDADAQTIADNGSFTLTATLSAGSAYDVSVATQPKGYRCIVLRGAGTMPTSDITDVAITCTQITTSIGGSIDGLSSTGLVLTSGNDILNVPADATKFTMPTMIASGAAYNVSVRSSPAAMHCAVSNGSGTAGDAAIDTIGVRCTPATLSMIYSFGDKPDGQAPVAAVIQARDGNFYGTTYLGGANGEGTVFKLTPAGVETVLWSFGADGDGSQPITGLVQGGDGDFYGLTSQGGAYDNGTAFKVTATGVETVLWSFGGDGDGIGPIGSLLLASDGNFYGMTQGGGVDSDGVLFRLTPSGIETVMADFSVDTLSNPYLNGLTQGSDGNLYGLTKNGGTGNDGGVFKMTLDGVLTVLWSFDAEGREPTGSLVQADDGNFYGVTTQGGANNRGTIFRMTPSGDVSTVHTFGPSTDTDAHEASGGLLKASDGNLYGISSSGGDANHGTVYRLTPSGTESVLYSFPDADNPFYSYGSLIQGTDGGLYGNASAGGANGYGGVFQFK